MAGISTGVSLLSVGKGYSANISIASQVVGVSPTSPATTSLPYTVNLSGYGGITSVLVSFSSTTNQPSYSFSNAEGSLSNSINFTLSSGAKAYYDGTVTVSIYADGSLVLTRVVSLALGTYYVKLAAPTYSTSPYTVTDSIRYVNPTDFTDYWGQSPINAWQFTNTNNNLRPFTKGPDSIGVIFDPTFVGSGTQSSIITVAATDSKFVVGNFGLPFTATLTR